MPERFGFGDSRAKRVADTAIYREPERHIRTPGQKLPKRNSALSRFRVKGSL